MTDCAPHATATIISPPLWRPLYFAAAACGYVAVTDLLLAALHARGFAQTVLSYCIGLSALVQLPGFMAVQVAGLRHGHHTTLGVWIVLVIVNFAFYFVAAHVVLRALSWWRGSPAKVPAEDGSPRRVTRRQIVSAGAGRWRRGSSAIRWSSSRGGSK